MKLSERDCPICDSKDSSSLDWAINRDYSKPMRTTKITNPEVKDCELVLCNFCKLAYYKSYPAILREHYEDNYRVKETLINEARLAENQAKNNLFYNLMHQFLKPGQRVLDIGCSEGFYINHLNRLGYDAEGVELTKICVDLGTEQGLKIFQGDVLEFKPEKKFDFVFTSGYIEHVEDPKKIMKYLKENVLTKDGYVYLGTPDLLNPNTETFSDYFPYEHVQTFSKETLAELCHVSGYDVVFHKGDNYNFGQAMIAKVNDSFEPKANYSETDMEAWFAGTRQAYENKSDDVEYLKFIDFSQNGIKEVFNEDNQHISTLKLHKLLGKLDPDSLTRIYLKLLKVFDKRRYYETIGIKTDT